jgi:hypothetical protein
MSKHLTVCNINLLARISLMIVIEGMDNSGKSTLGEALAEYLDMVVQESGGPPLSDEEINSRVDAYAELNDRVFVRHPVISNAIYGKFRPEGDPITPGRAMLFYEAKPLLIYCDAGDRGFDGHILKDHDTEVHQKLLATKQEELLKEYRLWAAQKAHFIYRIGDDMDELVSTINYRLAYREA